MSFDNIQLPSSLIADLYKQSLVLLDDVQPNSQQQNAKATISQTDNSPAKHADNITSAPKSAGTEQVAEQPAPVAPAIHYIGGFKQQISVVIADAQYKEIAPADLDFLKKLMTACKLTIDDFAVINIHANQPVVSQLWKLMPAKIVLLFGVPASDVGLPAANPDFQVQNWNNMLFMAAPELAAFQEPDSMALRARKRELWEALQKIFLGK